MNNKIEIQKTDTFVEHNITKDGVVVGTVELCPEKKEIERLDIFTPYQNKGYGTQVVKELVNQGYTSLWVRSDNERAIHVYEKCGFVKGDVKMYEMKLQHTNTGENMNMSKWISCSEQLPSEVGTYIVTVKNIVTVKVAPWDEDEISSCYYVELADYYTDWILEHESIGKKVIAWMPLPEPFTE